jgi:hypothetical protein
VSRRIRVWDFGAAKGTGASVVDFDPHADNTSQSIDLSARPKGNHCARPSEPKSADRLLQELDVDATHADEVAYRLVQFHRRRTKPIPQDLRTAVSRLVYQKCGNQHAAQQVLYGLHDDHLQELLP